MSRHGSFEEKQASIGMAGIKKDEAKICTHELIQHICVELPTYSCGMF